MGQVIDLQDWRRRHQAGSTTAGEPSPARHYDFWVEPMLLSALDVWRAAAVIWVGATLAGSGEVGFPRPANCASAVSPSGRRA
jgi:hypothetical protein